MWWGGGLSVLLHGLFTAAIFFAPVRERLSDTLFSAEVELAVTPDEVEDDDEPPVPEDSEASAAPEAAAARAPVRRTPLVGALATAETVATVEILPDTLAVPPLAPFEPDHELAAEDRERERERLAMVLNPERYARDSVIRDDPGPSRRGPPAGGGDAEGGLGPATPMLSEAEAEAMHSGHLREAAMRRDWITHHAIVPTEQTDGSWVYAGPLFTARISPTGAVSFDDRDAVTYDLGTGAGGFDLTDMVMGGAGADPYAAERERFMEETEDLRVRLENAARAGDMERAVRRARVRIGSIWNDEERDAEARRRALFRIWDDCSDDDEGRSVRDGVIEFIRENLPCGSENGYTQSEIDGLNATRESTERFDPC